MLRHKVEADVVLVFNMEAGKSRDWNRLMRQVRDDLANALPAADIRLGENIAVHVTIRNPSREPVEIDVVPSFSVNSPLQAAQVRMHMLYQGITTVWHVEYVKMAAGRYSRYREAVMLLKHWKSEHGVPLESFHLELIAASALANREPESPDLIVVLDACFREIQSFCDGLPVFPVDWDWYDDEAIHDSFPTQWVIVDPANPRDNLAVSLDQSKIDVIRSKATRAISKLRTGELAEILDPDGLVDFDW